MCYFAGARKRRTIKVPAFFEKFQTEEYILSVNKSKNTAENTFNGDHFWTEGNNKPSNKEKTLL